MKTFKLNEENYYSAEADMEYMSCSQYQAFCDCEAKKLAELQGRWKSKPSEAFLVGNFFHSYFEGKEAHAKFCEDNLESIYTSASIKKYQNAKETKELSDAQGLKNNIVPEDFLILRSPYEKAVEMIATVEKDPLMQRFLNMDGKNEMYMTGEIFGTKWRMKMDKYVPDIRFIIDYKTVANIWETSYNPVKRERETFVDAYGYMFRAAVYSMIEVQNALNLSFDDAYKQLKNGELDVANFFLLCVSKQEHPDKEVLRLNNLNEYLYNLDKIKDKQHRFNMIKAGRMLPRRCGKCDYCRATKVLKEIRPYYEIMPEFRTESEEDYNAVKGLVTA